MSPVSPPEKASEDAAPTVVKVPPPGPPKSEPPSGFVVSGDSNCQMSKDGASKNAGADAVAGDSTGVKGSGKGGKGGDANAKDDATGDAADNSSSNEDGSTGKGERANRYRYQQRRRTIKGETKHRRKLQPSPNATSKTPGAEGDGVKAGGVKSDGCPETQTDALSVDSGVVKQGTLLWTIVFCMMGCPLLLL
jgi:hypothetical protein